MYYYQVQPHPILAPFIQFYWAVRVGSRTLPAPDHGVIPGGYVDIIFHAGDPVYLSDSGDIFVEKEKSFVVGPFDHFQRFHTEGRFTFLGVRFRPGRNPFVSANFSLEEMRNRAVPLDTAWGDKGLRAGIQAVELRLAQVSETAQQIACVERFLMKLLGHFQEPDPIVTPAIGSIEESQGQIPVEALASALGISSRQLERKFIQHVGLSPKAFCRVTRFRQAKRLLESNPGSSGCELAYACGYYDQTHFIREFRWFTGQTPARYEKARPVGFFLYKR